MTFKELNIIEPILKALDVEGYKAPSPIQAEAIPILLSSRDLLGCAQTGTGKTAAFAIPILQALYNERDNTKKRTVKSLILTPTRELALQISESFQAYGRYTGVKTAVIFGGVSQNPQVAQLRAGVDVLVATPGRLNDLIRQNLCDLGNVSMFVLDEADRMLDMGFIHDVKKIISWLPKERQNLLFSATMPKSIEKLASSFLQDPAMVAVTPVSSTVDMIDQSVYFVDKPNKAKLLIELLKDETIASVLVFSRTKHGADKICKVLKKANIYAKAIHGDKSQNARQSALTDFKTGMVRVLVATDIAARGIDIDQISHVINYDLPNEPETYVHRIGRTGRAGHRGIAISFCNFDEKAYLKDIQKLIKKEIDVVLEHPYPMQIFEPTLPKTQPRLTRAEREAKTAAKATAQAHKKAVNQRNKNQKKEQPKANTARTGGGAEMDRNKGRDLGRQARSNNRTRGKNG